VTRLQYVGPAPGSGILPLPEGWPPFDHDEPDADISREKLASGYYRAAEAEGDVSAPTPGRRRTKGEED